MSSIDIWTLALCLGLVNVMQFVAFYTQYKINKTSHGPGWWALASGLMALGFVALLVRAVPALATVSIIAYNMLFIPCFPLVYVGICRFLGRREPRAFLVASLVAALAAAVYFTYGDDSIVARRVNISLVCAVFSLLSARALSTAPGRDRSAASRLVAGLFGINAAALAAMSLSPVLRSLHAPLLPMPMPLLLSYLTVMVTSPLWSIGLITLVNQRLAQDNREAQENLRLLFDATPEAVVVTRADGGGVVAANHALRTVLGLEWTGLGDAAASSPRWTYDGRTAGFLAMLRDNPDCANVECSCVKPDGELFVGLLSARTMTMDGRACVISLVKDISNRKRAERFEQFRSAVLEVLAASDRLPDILAAIAAGVARLDAGMRCCLFAWEPGQREPVVAAAGLPEAFAAVSLGRREVQELLCGAGRCAAPGLVVTEDLEGCPGWEPYRALATASGLRSCWTLPFRDAAGQLLGALAVFHARLSRPREQDAVLMTQCARLAGIAVARARADALLRESEFRWKFAIEGAGDGVWDWNIATDETQFSRRWKAMLGFAEDDVAPAFRQWRDRLHPDDEPAAMQRLRAYLAGESPDYVLEFRLRCKDGGYKWILSRGVVVERGADGRPARMIGTHTDISRSKQVEEELKRSKLFLQSVLDGLSAHVALLDATGDILLVNKAWRDFASQNGMDCALVCEGANYLAASDGAAVCSAEAAAVAKGIRDVLSGEAPRFVMEYPCHGPGVQRWFIVRVTPFPGDGPRRAVVAHEDISQRKLMEMALAESHRRFETLSATDGLTEIANRRRFNEALGVEFARHARSGGELALVMLDIDFFKLYNDAYGHVQGDACLKAVAGVLVRCLKRPSDLAARYGGEEFICLLPETSFIGAVIVAEDIRRSIEALAMPHAASAVAGHVTASVGVFAAKCLPDGTPEELVRAVDSLLYRAKTKGRNRIECDGAAIGTPPAASPPRAAVQLLWDASFATGDAVIDGQHENLLVLANGLIEAARAGAAKDAVAALVAALTTHVRAHFEEEECILREIGYPDAAAHAAVHEGLVQRGEALSRDFAADAAGADDVVQFVVNDIVLGHMLHDDTRYYPWLRAHPRSGQG